MREEKIVYKAISDIHPYKRNPRKNKNAIDPVKASIEAFGFKSPIQIKPDGTIINGHTRYEAAKRLGYDTVPCVVVDDLTEEEIREYRLIDNKSAEYAQWDKDLLAGELAEIDLSSLSFSFDFDDDIRKKESWKETTKKCDLKIYMRACMTAENRVLCLFKAGKNGVGLQELKRPEYVRLFADNAIDYIRTSFGGNLSECGWALVTTPRRRHKDDFHFATAVCREIALELRIPFYEDAVVTHNRDRVSPDFELAMEIPERNLILYDDIVTTGSTFKATKNLFIDQGKTVFGVVAICNT